MKGRDDYPPRPFFIRKIWYQKQMSIDMKAL